MPRKLNSYHACNLTDTNTTHPPKKTPIDRTRNRAETTYSAHGQRSFAHAHTTLPLHRTLLFTPTPLTSLAQLVTPNTLLSHLHTKTHAFDGSQLTSYTHNSYTLGRARERAHAHSSPHMLASSALPTCATRSPLTLSLHTPATALASHARPPQHATRVS